MEQRIESGCPRRLLAVFAHPDDESFGPGGTLARYAAEGAEVYLITATRGEEGKLHGHTPPFTKKTMGRIRTEELNCAAGNLGLSRWLLLGYEDGSLFSVPREELTEHIVRFIRTWRPQVILTFPPDGLTGHPDHVAISKASAEAFDLSGSRRAFPRHFQEGLEPYAPEKLYFYVVPESKAAHLDDALTATPDDQVTAVVDYVPAATLRRKAVCCHYSQLAQRPRWMSLRVDPPNQKTKSSRMRDHFILAKTRLKSGFGLENGLFVGMAGKKRNAGRAM